MSSDRPYRRARDIDYIIEELKRCSGTQFDPQVVEEAVKILNERKDKEFEEWAIQQAEARLQNHTNGMQTI